MTEWTDEEEELCILVGGLNFVELDMCLPERSRILNKCEKS